MVTVSSIPVVRRIAFVDGINVLRVIENKFSQHIDVSAKPNWPKVRQHLARVLQGDCRLDYYVNAFAVGDKFFSMARWLKTAGGISTRYCDEVSPGFDQSDPVDSTIQAELDFFAEKASSQDPTHILLFAHDHGYAPFLKKAITAGCPVWICGFGEEMHDDLKALRSEGARIADIEHDLDAFRAPIPNRPPLSTLKRLKLTIR